MTAIEEAVRAWAKGLYTLEAGVELLIRQGKTIREGAPWIERSGGERASVDVERLLDESGAWSGGEQRVVRIASSLLGGPPVDLGEDVSGLDRDHLQLVLAAIAHAGGSHQHSDLVAGEDGSVSYQQVDSLYPWPKDN